MEETRGDKRRKRRHKRRNFLIDKLGGVCVHCGTTDELTFDHIDRSTKEFVLSGRGLDVSWEKLLAEAEKCQLLCDSCHKIKTIEEDRV